MYQQTASTLPGFQPVSSRVAAHRALRSRGKLIAATALVGITLGAGLISGSVQHATNFVIRTLHIGTVQIMDGGPWVVQSQDGGPWVVQSQDGGPWVVQSQDGGPWVVQSQDGGPWVV